MNREEAAEALQLLRRVVTQARAAIIPIHLVSIFWLQRKEAAGVRSFIERQVCSIWSGLLLHRARRRRLAAGGVQARLV